VSVKHAAAGALVGAVVAKGIPTPYIIAGALCAVLYMLFRLIIRLARVAVQWVRLSLAGQGSEGRISTLEQELATAQRQVAELRAAHAELNDVLRIAHGKVADLEDELRTKEIADKELQRPEDVDPLYRRVGLSENAPSWLVVDARRSFRRKLHPDRYPEHGKEVAHKYFVEAEVVFDRIYDARGLRA
jgi:hypothetical protein